MKVHELLGLWCSAYTEEVKGRYVPAGAELGMAKALCKQYTDAQLEGLVRIYFEARENLFPPIDDEGYTFRHLYIKREALKQRLKQEGTWEEEE